MKLSAIAFLIVALLASIAFSVPTDQTEQAYYDDFYTTCSKDMMFAKPVDGIIYKINSTQVADLVISKECKEKFGMYKISLYIYIYIFKEKKNIFIY